MPWRPASLAEAMQFGAIVLVWGAFVRTVYVMKVSNCVNSITHLAAMAKQGERDRQRLIEGALIRLKL